MMSDEEIKKTILKKLRALNEFIRDMEDYAEVCNVDIEEEKLYIAVCAQRRMLRELVGHKVSGA